MLKTGESGENWRIGKLVNNWWKDEKLVKSKNRYPLLFFEIARNLTLSDVILLKEKAILVVEYCCVE